MGNKSSVAENATLIKNTTKTVIENPDVKIIKKLSPLVIIPNNKTFNKDNLNKEFINIVKDFKKHLKPLKAKLESHESDTSMDNKEKILIEVKNKMFPVFDSYFKKLYQHLLSFNKEEYVNHQKYLQNQILDYFVYAPLNLHIFVKPFGYPGDFELMNMIFDTNNNFDGVTMLQKLIHNYTGTSVMALSNIERKDFFINQLLKLSKSNKKNIKIGNIGCGSAREIFDFLKIKEDDKNYDIHCIDFESKAISHVHEKFNENKHRGVTYKLYQQDILDIIRGNFPEQFKNFDLIYSSGLFDYLKSGMAKRLINKMFTRLNKSSTMIIVNANAVNAYQRSYYEMLGEWQFIHRTQNEMMSWIYDKSEIYKDFHFEQTPQGGYNYLIINT